MNTISRDTETAPKTSAKTPLETFRFELRPPPPRPRWPKTLNRKSAAVLVFAGLFGIVLPAATVAIELYTRMCAETFFDPIPTLWHAVLAALVPAANLALVWALIRGNTKRPGALFLANGVAIGVSGFYALLFLPLAPLAAVAVVIYGLGLLPLAPLFGLISALMLRRALRRQVETSGPARATPSAMPRVTTVRLMSGGRPATDCRSAG